VLHCLTELFVAHGPPEHVRSDKWPQVISTMRCSASAVLVMISDPAVGRAPRFVQGASAGCTVQPALAMDQARGERGVRCQSFCVMGANSVRPYSAASPTRT